MPIKSLSDAKIALAKEQSKILKILFKNISNGEFDLNVDLSTIPAEQLDDFWLYTTGFLCVHSFEQSSDNIDDHDATELLNGNFDLKELTIEEAETLAKNAGKRINMRGFYTTTDLYTIQDGTYSIIRNKSVDKPIKRYINCLSLKTNEVEYYTDKEELDITSSQMINIIRNLIVHTTPYINGSKLTLIYGDDEVKFTKMWLRGYSETFLKTHNAVNIEDIRKILTTYVKDNNLNLSNNHEIYSAVKNALDKIFDKNQLLCLRNLLGYRLPYFEDFYEKPLDEKIEILSTIISNNPNYIDGNYETINPAIIYNLQQLVSKELVGRGLDSAIDDDDPELVKLINLGEKLKELSEKLDDFDKKHPTLRSKFEIVQLDRLKKECNSAVNQFDMQEKSLKNRLKLESSHMEMYDLESLKYLPLETGVNLVCMMGYNSLVTSGFYEDLLANTDYNKLNLKQVKFFDNFKFKGITSNYYDNLITEKFNTEQKIYLLKSIRNAIVHAKIYYTLPKLSVDKKPNFKDVVIHFTSGWGELDISGKLIDFYNLFNQTPFMFSREKDIITGEYIPYETNDSPQPQDTPDSNSPDTPDSQESGNGPSRN